MELLTAHRYRSCVTYREAVARGSRAGFDVLLMSEIQPDLVRASSISGAGSVDFDASDY
jgi:hypothetical protein